jgi:hypothetical protein
VGRAGPYTITDNYLEAASENVMFGGADSASADRVPADILIDGNLFSKRLEWKPIAPAKTSGKVVKNLLELKAAKRVVDRETTPSSAAGRTRRRATRCRSRASTRAARRRGPSPRTCCSSTTS